MLCQGGCVSVVTVNSNQGWLQEFSGIFRVVGIFVVEEAKSVCERPEHCLGKRILRVLTVRSCCLYFVGKRYNVVDVSAALCMSLGLIWFTLADSTVAPNFNLTGKDII